ncbi:GNAT family protein [Fluviicola sp.]|uniref:GNAT family N-acetyltransferase n=1 Tax=Fluviicola sp. TaxID=1917219 RepID=UPI002639A402|nr:GNAT family protein [Fluviicola sp.]
MRQNKQVNQFISRNSMTDAIEALVSPQNRGAISLLEHLGFEKEAHFKERIFFNNTYSDMAVYTLFKSQFEEKGNPVDQGN